MVMIRSPVPGFGGSRLISQDDCVLQGWERNQLSMLTTAVFYDTTDQKKCSGLGIEL